jgi:rhodanese-related sulfurtransferase
VTPRRRSGPYHVERFEPGRRVIVSSGAGFRSPLAVRCRHEPDSRAVAHLDGGLKAWIDEGGPMTGPTTAR